MSEGYYCEHDGKGLTQIVTTYFLPDVIVLTLRSSDSFDVLLIDANSGIKSDSCLKATSDKYYIINIHLKPPYK